MQGEAKTVMLISYETYQFGWTQSSLQQGDMESARNGEGVLLVSEPGFTAEAGSEMELETDMGRQKVKVSGILKNAPFHSGENVGTLICSENLFRELTGKEGDTILDIQLQNKSDDAAETLVYLVGGLAEGLLLGMPLHYYLYRQAITLRWGDV